METLRALGFVAAISLTGQIEGLCHSSHPFNTPRQRYAKSAFAAVGHSRPSKGSLTAAAVIGCYAARPDRDQMPKLQLLVPGSSSPLTPTVARSVSSGGTRVREKDPAETQNAGSGRLCNGRVLDQKSPG